MNEQKPVAFSHKGIRMLFVVFAFALIFAFFILTVIRALF